MNINYFLNIFKVIDDFGSFLMKFILRIGGAKIGKNTYVSFKSRIVSRDILIGDDCYIKGNATIKAKNIKIGNNCIISDGCFITGSDNFTLGDKSYIGKYVRINLSKGVKIGSDVGLAEGSKIFTHGFFPPVDYGYPVTYAPVTIGNSVWISSNSIILPKVNIGNDVIVGPGTVITKSIPPDSIINGNPAKFVTNTSKLRNQQPFLSTIEKVFKEFNNIEVISKGEGYTVYDLKNENRVYVLDGDKFKFEKVDIKKRAIVIYKFMNNSEKYRNKDYFWFDLDTREMTPLKNRSVKMIQDILRANGIRLLKDYLN